jgi:hypothetical protein
MKTKPSNLPKDEFMRGFNDGIYNRFYNVNKSTYYKIGARLYDVLPKKIVVDGMDTLTLDPYSSLNWYDNFINDKNIDLVMQIIDDNINSYSVDAIVALLYVKLTQTQRR